MPNIPIDNSTTVAPDDVEGFALPIVLHKEDQRRDDARLTRMEQMMETLAQATVQNTTAIKAVQEGTSEVVEIFAAMKGGVKVLGWLGQLVKWLAPIIAAYVAVRQFGSNAGWWPFR